jgi:hypothetical protein
MSCKICGAINNPKIQSIVCIGIEPCEKKAFFFCAVALTVK